MLEQTECPECGQIVHYQSQRWKAQVVCSNCQASFAIEATPPSQSSASPPAAAPIPSHLQQKAEQETNPPESMVAESQSETIRYRRSKVGGMITASLLFMTLASAIVGGIWGLALFDSRTAEKEKQKKEKANKEKAVEKINYTTAGRKRARLGELEVGITRVEYGPLRVKDQNNVVQESSESLLQIYLEIRSRRDDDVQYVSWYGNSFKSSGGDVIAELKDSKGNVFNMPVFEGVKSMLGHTPRASLEKGQRIEDCIIFELPSKNSISDIKEFRLSLPMECFGNSGALYFKIPSEFIRLVDDANVED